MRSTTWRAGQRREVVSAVEGEPGVAEGKLFILGGLDIFGRGLACGIMRAMEIDAVQVVSGRQQG